MENPRMLYAAGLRTEPAPLVSTAGGLKCIGSEVRTSKEVVWVAVEEYTEWRILECSMRQVFGPNPRH